MCDLFCFRSFLRDDFWLFKPRLLAPSEEELACEAPALECRLLGRDETVRLRRLYSPIKCELVRMLTIWRSTLSPEALRECCMGAAFLLPWKVAVWFWSSKLDVAIAAPAALWLLLLASLNRLLSLSSYYCRFLLLFVVDWNMLGRAMIFFLVEWSPENRYYFCW